MNCPDKNCLTCTTHIYINPGDVKDFLERCIYAFHKSATPGSDTFYFNQCVRMIHILKWWD